MAANEQNTYDQAVNRIIKMQVPPVTSEASQEVSSAVTSKFAHVEALPPDAIFFTKARYGKDKDPRKINLGIGAYRTNEGKPYILEVVKEAEQFLLKDTSLNKEYLPIGGDNEFILASQKSILGDCKALAEGRVAGVQTLSGTGSLRIISNFFANNFPGVTIYKSDPTWGNHRKVFMKAGLNQANYRYWDANTKGLDINGMLEDLNNAPAGSVILLHACAHNPTGVDPTKEQWMQIRDVCKNKGHIAFFDSAYQGYATGDLDNDAYAVRLFETAGMEFVISQSYSKNLGLYGERVGCATVVCASPEIKKACDTQLRAIIRPMYSNPPKHGCYIAKRVLTNPVQFEAWKKELAYMSNRIVDMRAALKKALIERGCPGNWDHITDQIGMFSYTGLTPTQVEYIEKKYHIYMLSTGRVSMAGVNRSSVGYIAEAMTDAVKNVK